MPAAERQRIGHVLGGLLDAVDIPDFARRVAAYFEGEGFARVDVLWMIGGSELHTHDDCVLHEDDRRLVEMARANGEWAVDAARGRIAAGIEVQQSGDAIGVVLDAQPALQAHVRQQCDLLAPVARAVFEKHRLTASMRALERSEQLQSAPGGVAQVRESAALLVRFAKQSGTAIFLVGHVTKEGALAGPRVLEHMVDTVLYFEGESDGRLRLLRAVKNRFGAINELGVFGMTDKGLKEVTNPSAIFLTRAQEAVPGSVVMATWEGTRPMLVEVQALVDTSHMANPRRVTLGLDQNRLAMLLAVLHRHGGIPTYDQDVFINVVGGVKVLETASDLALMAAVISSLRNRPLDTDLLVFGEVGLSGEIRPVPSGQERLKEAAKHGFKRAIVPKGNAPKEAPAGLQVIAVTRLEQALDALFE